jgi:hypothetical protein
MGRRLSLTGAPPPSLWGARGEAKGVRLAEWVPPVGGALSGHTSTWQVQAAGAHRPSDRRGRVVPRSKQPRRCQAARGVADRARTPVGKNTPLLSLRLTQTYTLDF